MAELLFPVFMYRHRDHLQLPPERQEVWSGRDLEFAQSHGWYLAPELTVAPPPAVSEPVMAPVPVAKKKGRR